MLKIGWSKRDVSTDKPVAITGQFHVRISKGIMDPIMLNCLVIDNKKDIVIFLSGDFVSGRNSIDIIQKKMKSAYPEIPAEKIILNITHTHCGADLSLNREYTFEPVEGIEIYPTNDYIEFFTNTAVDMIKEAYDNRKEGYIAYGYGYAVVSHSRRSTYFDDVSLRLGHISTRKDQAEFICNSFDEVLSWAKKELISDAPLSHTIKTLKLKEIPLTKEQYNLATEQIEIL